MPPKAKTLYACTSCGAEYTKWYGRCTACGEWNSIEEHIQAKETPLAAGQVRRGSVQKIGDINQSGQQRYHTGIK